MYPPPVHSTTLPFSLNQVGLEKTMLMDVAASVTNLFLIQKKKKTEQVLGKIYNKS